MVTKQKSKNKKSLSDIREQVIQLAVKAGRDEEEVRALFAPRKTREEKRRVAGLSREEGLKKLRKVVGLKVLHNGKNGKTKVAKFYVKKEKRLVWHPGQNHPEALVQEGVAGKSYVKVTVEEAERILKGTAKARLVVK